VVVVSDGSRGGIKHAPIYGISPKLHEQGILDTALQGFKGRFEGRHEFSIGELQEFRMSPSDSLYFTEPQPATGPDTETILGALYHALIAPRGGGGSRVPTKGRLIDQVVRHARGEGLNVGWGQYVDDFLFDAVIDDGERPLLSVLSFATNATTSRSWEAVEKDAGHFLYAVEQVGRPGLAVVAPPTSASHQHARDSFARVGRWFRQAGVAETEPEGVVGALSAFAKS
jgi:hypothetical protein